MVEVYCENCKYRFAVKPGKKLPTKCPYCSSEGSFRKVKSAQDLLDEIVPSDED